MKEDLSSVNAAFVHLQAVRDLIDEARRRYRPLKDRIEFLRSAEVELNADSIARLNEIKALEAEVKRLQPAVNDSSGLVKSALEALRAANGVFTISVVTPEIGALIVRRANQGYSLNQIAAMTGCAASTVANIKAGRYTFSDLPPDAKIGARGRA